MFKRGDKVRIKEEYKLRYMSSTRDGVFYCGYNPSATAIDLWRTFDLGDGELSSYAGRFPLFHLELAEQVIKPSVTVTGILMSPAKDAIEEIELETAFLLPMIRAALGAPDDAKLHAGLHTYFFNQNKNVAICIGGAISPREAGSVKFGTLFSFNGPALIVGNCPEGIGMCSTSITLKVAKSKTVLTPPEKSYVPFYSHITVDIHITGASSI